MDRMLRFRTGVLLGLIACVIVLYGVRLYKVQLASQDAPLLAEQTYTYDTTVAAARGSILDADGEVLVTSRTSYNLALVNFVLFSTDSPNERLLELVRLCGELGVAVTDHLPVSATRPYQYTAESLSATWQGYFATYCEKEGLDPAMSAEQLIRTLADRYRLPEGLSDAERRALVGVRYELDLRYDTYGTNLENYIIAYDVPTEQLATILELGTPGLNVQASTARVYETEYCAHILGTVGLMDAEEYEYYETLGYPMNAVVGKSGLELAFEETLHGQDGILRTTVTADGQIVSQQYLREPEPGDNVMLTIDLDLQMAAEDALEEVILDLRENGVGSSEEGMDAEGGAVVVMEVGTGKVLASGSYPTFNLATYQQDYAALEEEPYGPLYNRAVQATYYPGSVFKMVTTIAMIDHGGIGRYYEIEDEGVYTYYESYQPRCYYYTNTGLTHGILNVMQALSVSCNYYFFEVGRRTGIDAIEQVSEALGLGEKTGVEIPEESGYRAGPETKARLYADDPNNSGWYGGDTLAAAIGQSDNRFTPMQLCAYTATLASGGTRYRATFLDRVLASDYSGVISVTEPEVLGTCEISDEAMAAVREGMELAATEGTAASYFAGYPISVACKTGTVQHGSGGSDHASFVLYAPADDPQIAIAVYVEKGSQGGNLSRVTQAVMDVYFVADGGDVPATDENTLA